MSITGPGSGSAGVHIGGGHEMEKREELCFSRSLRSRSSLVNVGWKISGWISLMR